MQWQNYTCQSQTSRNKPYCSSKWKSGKRGINRVYRYKTDFPIKNIKCEMAHAWLEGLLNLFQSYLKN